MTREDLAILATAIEMAGIYINDYDVSKPSRVKTETRAQLEDAMAIVKREGLGAYATTGTAADGTPMVYGRGGWKRVTS